MINTEHIGITKSEELIYCADICENLKSNLIRSAAEKLKAIRIKSKAAMIIAL